jgi:hypothetical protein
MENEDAERQRERAAHDPRGASGTPCEPATGEARAARSGTNVVVLGLSRGSRASRASP